MLIDSKYSQTLSASWFSVKREAQPMCVQRFSPEKVGHKKKKKSNLEAGQPKLAGSFAMDHRS